MNIFFVEFSGSIRDRVPLLKSKRSRDDDDDEELVNEDAEDACDPISNSSSSSPRFRGAVMALSTLCIADAAADESPIKGTQHSLRDEYRSSYLLKQNTTSYIYLETSVSSEHEVDCL